VVTKVVKTVTPAAATVKVTKTITDHPQQVTTKTTKSIVCQRSPSLPTPARVIQPRL
jgi:hypothetical protein